MTLAGAARVDITPEGRVPLAGYPAIHVRPDGPQDHAGYVGRTEPSRGVADPIHARALAVAAGDDVAVSVALDVCVVSGAFTEHVRAQASRRFGVAADAIAIAASHTHSAPDHDGYWDEADAASAARVRDGAVAAIGAALEALEPARLGLGHGRLPDMTVNRRDPSRPTDDAVPVLRVDRRDGTPLALLYGFACHPIIAGAENLLVSGDYPGAASRVAEHALGHGVVALFLNGGAGNVNPRAFPYREKRNVVERGREARGVRTLTEAVRFGTALGGEVVRVAATIPTQDAAAVAAVRLPVHARRKDPDALEQFLDHLPHTPAVTARLRELAELPTEVSGLRIGPLALLFLPGEPFVETALELQDSGVRVVGFANDYPGYLVPGDQFGENRYESVATPLAPEGVEAIVDRAREVREILCA
jgi:neutral ceramidase